MTGKRLAALAAAVLLVAGAFVIRNAGDDDASSSDSTTAAGDTSIPAEPAGDARAVVCLPELRAVCDAIARSEPSRSVRVEDAATTLDALAALTTVDDAPVWVTVRPFPGMVDARRAASGDAPLALTEIAVASTPLAVAVLDEARRDALVAACGDRDIWACAGDHAGRPWTELGGQASWGTVRPAVGDVDRSATALVSFAAAMAGYVGTTDFNRTVWEADPTFLGWLRPLARTVSATDLSGGTPLATMATRPSAVNLAATTDAELGGLGAGADRFAAEYPRSAMSLDAVIAAPDGAGGDALASSARTVLTDAGWGPAADANGPSASTTLALHELWEVTT